MRLTDLKTRLRGIERRLERAEALLQRVVLITREHSLIAITSMLDNEAENISKFLGERLTDTETEQ